MVRAIGHVVIHQEMRPPGGEHFYPVPHFRRIGFQEIAVEIETGRGASKTLLCGADLVGAMKRRSILVTVNVENRQKEDDDILE